MSQPHVLPTERGHNVFMKDFHTDIRYGDSLIDMLQDVQDLPKRKKCDLINRFLQKRSHRVGILYGLPGTGKNTVMLQVISGMSAEDFDRTAYIEIADHDTMSNLEEDLKVLWHKGYRFIFIHEITRMPDFINTASDLSDCYAMIGMKIILSGSDSLSFRFAADDQLYDRDAMFLTTKISYGEHCEILGECRTEDYLRSGGTLYGDSNPFRNQETAMEYIRRAVCKNLTSSFCKYNCRNDYRKLNSLLEKGLLEKATECVIKETAVKYAQTALGTRYEDISVRLNEQMEMLQKEKETLGVTDRQVDVILQFLREMDVVSLHPDDANSFQYIKNPRYYFVQTGMCYRLTENLVNGYPNVQAEVVLKAVQNTMCAERGLSDIGEDETQGFKPTM